MRRCMLTTTSRKHLWCHRCLVGLLCTLIDLERATRLSIILKPDALPRDVLKGFLGWGTRWRHTYIPHVSVVFVEAAGGLQGASHRHTGGGGDGWRADGSVPVAWVTGCFKALGQRLGTYFLATVCTYGTLQILERSMGMDCSGLRRPAGGRSWTSCAS